MALAETIGMAVSHDADGLTHSFGVVERFALTTVKKSANSANSEDSASSEDSKAVRAKQQQQGSEGIRGDVPCP